MTLKIVIAISVNSIKKALAAGESGGLSDYYRVMELVFFIAPNKSAQLQLLEIISPDS